MFAKNLDELGTVLELTMFIDQGETVKVRKNIPLCSNITEMNSNLLAYIINYALDKLYLKGISLESFDYDIQKIYELVLNGKIDDILEFKYIDNKHEELLDTSIVFSEIDSKYLVTYFNMDFAGTEFCIKYDFTNLKDELPKLNKMSKEELIYNYLLAIKGE